MTARSPSATALLLAALGALGCMPEGVAAPDELHTTAQELTSEASAASGA